MPDVIIQQIEEERKMSDIDAMFYEYVALQFDTKDMTWDNLDVPRSQDFKSLHAKLCSKGWEDYVSAPLHPRKLQSGGVCVLRRKQLLVRMPRDAEGY